MRKTGLLVGVTMLVALAWVPAGEAQVAFRSAEADLELRVPVGQLEEYNDLDFGGSATGGDQVSGGAGLAQCGEALLDLEPDALRFHFAEGAEQTGCAEARYSFVPPPDATSMTVAFDANRRVEQPANTQLPVNAHQELRLYASLGAEPVATAYFPVTALTQPMSVFEYTLPTPPGDGEVVLAWLFADEGYKAGLDTTSPGSGQAFSASVINPVLRFPDVPLAAPQEIPGDVLTEGRNVTTTTILRFNLTEALWVNMTEARFLFDAEANLVGVNTERAEAPVNLLSQDFVNANRIVRFDRAFLAAQGPGNYDFIFTATTVLPPPPPPPPPITLDPYHLLILAVPVLPATAAVARSGRYALAARESTLFRRGAGLLFGAMVVLALYLAGVLAYVAAWLGTDPLRILPLDLDGILIYVQLGFLALLLFPAGFIASSRQHRTMVHVQERERKNSELARANNELQHFVSIAAHDLKEPLRKVSSFTKLLQQKYSGQLDEKADKYISLARDGAERMQRLIDDLRAYSGLMRTEVPDLEVDLNALVETVEHDMEGRIADARGKMTWEQLPIVRGSEGLLRQLMQNLVGNGIKYHDPERPPRVHVHGEETETEWIVHVRDNGIGIPEDQYDKVFQMFRRLVGKSEYEGTGIGLAFCQRIIELHQGRIWLTSELGKGSTFSFAIPREREERSTQQE